MNANNGLPGKPGVPLNTVDGRKLKADAGIPHLPTQLTYDCRLAISGQGPLAYTWEDKPHRLVYNLCREIERVAAAATPAEIAAKDARIAELEAQLTALQRDASKQVATDELVRRLQHLGDWQAADRIEGLQKRVAELEAALDRIADTDPDEGTAWFHEVARAAAKEGKP